MCVYVCVCQSESGKAVAVGFEMLPQFQQMSEPLAPIKLKFKQRLFSFSQE